MVEICDSDPYSKAISETSATNFPFLTRPEIDMRQFRSNSLDRRHRPWPPGSSPISPSALSDPIFDEKVDEESPDIPEVGLTATLFTLKKTTPSSTFIPSVGNPRITRWEWSIFYVP